ncbi:MAG: glutaredoxin family protein [Armatimonadetes bacterium]|nr:glutaredoxin family protein [Armatimonadota bacterium]
MTSRRLTVYGRPNCRLCEVALAMARRAAPADVAVAHADIRIDPEIEGRYRERIPVLVLDGREIGAGRREDVAQALRRAFPERR